MPLPGRVLAAKPPAQRAPLWTGPDGKGPNGGVTQSLLARFLTCRERFRVRAVEGLRPPDQFSHRLEYGNLWHVCEEALAKGNDPTRGNRLDRSTPLWLSALTNYASDLCRRYPLQQEQVEHWYHVCRVQFPVYVKHWADHPDVKNRTPLLQEQAFDVPYQLPSGRAVRLRGRWDSVDLVEKVTDLGNGKKMARKGIWLQENKTKGDVDEEALTRQLTNDLQSMFYLVALEGWQRLDDYGEPVRFPPAATTAIAGVRYNVVRRPLSGGKGTIVRHKATQGAKCPTCKGTGKSRASFAFGGDGRCKNCHGGGRVNAKPEETKEAFYGRVRDGIESDPGHFFLRLEVPVSPADVADFRRRTLDPVLEQLCDWWDWLTYRPQVPGPTVLRDVDLYAPRETPDGSWWISPHWQHPYGCVNTVDEYGWADVDSYLATGSETGLQRTETLFPELQ